MQLQSVNISLPQEVPWQGKLVRTSIFKQPIAGAVAVQAEHLAGDGQADLRVHGGRDKAVYAYPQEHWAYWQQVLPAAQLVPGAFGENLTTTGLLEAEVRVGDCFQIGTVVLLAVQPRQPCFKLAIRLGRPSIVREFEAAGRNGIYFRVQQTGVLSAGDAITLIERSPYPVTIQDMANCLTADSYDQDKVQALLATPYLSASWRERLTRLLA
ncbi:MOSC domain-containing protein [Hymenobacter ginsengisoli]|uniref:MOSC domain-containing protein n=1 Tax=Hymenobacter ginsengisoli TaxID=1051626 RepID=A0ABP8Q911_9BACT|nr:MULTISPECIES: MOSC domain-containing protein [unclassified Hymenobacter]MBO2033997.1 MOSC domain-containing protein [Hymenobacter sp. BT559]